MLAVSSLAATSWAPAAAPMRATPMRSSSVTMETKEDLVALAKDLNPVSADPCAAFALLLPVFQL